MTDGQIRFLIIAIYMALLVVLGGLASRFFQGTKKDYLVASHSIGPVFLLLSLFGTTMTAFALIGSTAESFRKGIGIYGMLASASGIVHSLCFYLIGVKLWKFGKQHGHLTQIQFFNDRLESRWVGLMLFPILVCLTIPYLLVGVIGGGEVINAMTAGAFVKWFPVVDSAGNPLTGHGAVPNYLGSALVCMVVLIYVFFGGMRGTAWANAMQTAIFMVLGLVTFILLAYQLGGRSGLMESMQAASQSVDPKLLAREGIPKSVFLTYLLIPLSVAMFPHIFQHWLTARSAEAFKLAVVCHPLFVMIVWAPCVLIGVWATTIELPAAVAARPNAVLPYLVMSELTPVVAGLLTAGLLAAIMSSLDSQFLCLGSMFTNDIVDRFAGRNILSDRVQVGLTRCFIVAIVGLTYWISLSNHPSIFWLGVWCFSGFAALFPMVFAALYWKRLTAAGAFAGIVATMLSWGYLFYQSGWGSNVNYKIPIPFTEIEILPVAPILFCSALSMVLTSWLTPAPGEQTIRKYFPEG
jgi:SSS family solute:Na+ symporter